MTHHRAVAYGVYPTRYDEFAFPDKYVWVLRVEERRDNLWAVVKLGSVLNKAGEWEYEPIPSERDDEFLASTRFSLEEALRLAESLVDGIRWNGFTAAEADARRKRNAMPG